MTTFSFAADVRIARPATDAWAVLADYANDVRWRRGVRSMIPTPSGPVALGTTTEEVLRFAGSTYHYRGVVTALDPGRHFTWRTEQGADGSRTVEPTGPASCVVHLRLNVTLPGLQRLAAPLLRHNLTGDARRLRALLQRQSAGSEGLPALFLRGQEEQTVPFRRKAEGRMFGPL